MWTEDIISSRRQGKRSHVDSIYASKDSQLINENTQINSCIFVCVVIN